MPYGNWQCHCVSTVTWWYVIFLLSVLTSSTAPVTSVQQSTDTTGNDNIHDGQFIHLAIQQTDGTIQNIKFEIVESCKVKKCFVLYCVWYTLNAQFMYVHCIYQRVFNLV